MKKTTPRSPKQSNQDLLSESLRLFGFQIGPDYQGKQTKGKSFAIPQTPDGAVTIQSGGIYGTYIDLEGIAKNEIELITRYREMSLQPECEAAIDDVVNEAIVVEEQEPPVKINLDKLEGYSDEFKDTLIKEFKGVLKLLNFNESGHDIFKRWYVDGRLYYHMMIDNAKPTEGIQELKYIDPRRIRKVRQIQKKLNENGVEVIDGVLEYYIYNERGINNTQSTAVQGVKIATDTICNVNSGLVDSTRNMILSYLHKAIKPMNQLRMMEDALVIYRLSRAPERRIFYIDVGNLPKLKAEQYLKDIMNKYRNKTILDAATGEIRDDKKFLSLMEDYWLPRREGQKSTEIDTLSGGENLGEITDVNFFQEKLYRSLGVPISRLKSDTGFSLGRSSEISRDEIKFSKFVSRIRNTFKQVFDIILKTQLLLKGIVTIEDWEEIHDGIFYDFLKDSYYSELKEQEILNTRINTLAIVNPFVGVFYSRDYVMRNILKMNNEEIKEQLDQIKSEKPLIPDEMEAEAKLQKDLINFQTDKQVDMMGKQADVQGDQMKQQARLQNQGMEGQNKQLELQHKLEKTKMQHTIVKGQVAQQMPKKAPAKSKPGKR